MDESAKEPKLVKDEKKNANSRKTALTFHCTEKYSRTSLNLLPLTFFDETTVKARTMFSRIEVRSNYQHTISNHS